MLNLDEPQTAQKIALFNSGFRIFFLAAGVFSVISMLIWLLIYSLNSGPDLYHLNSLSWHAHEMIYGYTVAVISGFLLTATTNWTNRKTLTGLMLALAATFWFIARISPFLTYENNIEIMFVAETLFFLFLLVGITKPIIQSRQWQQLPVLFPVILLSVANTVFYAGELELIENGAYIGLYSGFYLILTLIFIMGRRVIPFFIEKGVDENFSAKNYIWLDRVVIPVFVVYALLEVLKLNNSLLTILAAVLFILNSIRLYGWYTKGIWKKPLLWILFIAYLFITLGFALRLLSYFVNFSDFIVLHSYAVGGVGMITVGMMSRVALGHTGRNVFEPPVILSWVFGFIFLAAITRVVLPLLLPLNYINWILLSQVFWVGAFALFVKVYAAMLINTRIDGRPG